MAQRSYAQNTEHHVTLSSTCFDDGYSSTILCRYTHSPPSLCPPNFPFLYKTYVHVCMCTSDSLLCMYVEKSFFYVGVCVCAQVLYVCVCFSVFFALFFSVQNFASR